MPRSRTGGAGADEGMMFEPCGLQLQATGGATDGATWTCELRDEHIGPHLVTFEMTCAHCPAPVVCRVTWDQHPDGHGLVTV